MSARIPLQSVLMMLAVLALGASAAHAERAHVEGQLVVHFKERADRDAKAVAHARAVAAVAERIPAINVEVVRVADERSALARYSADAAVRLAELDVIARALHDDCSTELAFCQATPRSRCSGGSRTTARRLSRPIRAPPTMPTSTRRMPGDRRPEAP